VRKVTSHSVKPGDHAFNGVSGCSEVTHVLILERRYMLSPGSLD